MKKGFTLIELIAVIAIIGVLTVLVVPNVIKIFKTSNDNTMNTQKNNLVDSAKIMIEDYCINPLGSTEIGQCNIYFLEDTSSTYRYVCYETLKNTKYLDLDYDLEYSGEECKAMVIFTDKMSEEGYRYNTVKSYVKCGEAYDDASAVKSDYADAYNTCIDCKVSYGDVNFDGEVTSLDASLILQFDAFMINLTSCQLKNADVNNDGDVDTADATDATFILEFEAGNYTGTLLDQPITN